MEKIAVLGPEYSYCHILARKLFPKGNFELCKNIEEIFRQVNEGKCEQGVAPVENMIHGTVRESLIALQKYRVKINRAADFGIHHCLASKTEKFNKITSKAEALSQCTKLLSQMKDKVVEESASTSQAMQIASKNADYAAIGSEDAALSLGLKIIKRNVEDNNDNVTRFILISKKENVLEKKKEYRTSMMIIPKKDKPGLLFEILSVFKIKEINLTKIESIPSGKKMGEYEFFLEINGSEKEENVSSALQFLRTLHEVYSFGSYELDRVN